MTRSVRIDLATKDTLSPTYGENEVVVQVKQSAHIDVDILDQQLNRELFYLHK